jgi:hypothetical protein
MKKLKTLQPIWPRLSITAALMLLVVWGLVLVTMHLTDGIVKDTNGIVVDSYQRSSDVLHIVVPLLTIALGYWFGAEGKENAEKRAAAAQTEATTARRQLTAVLGSSSEADQLLQKAKAADAEAFLPQGRDKTESGEE